MWGCAPCAVAFCDATYPYPQQLSSRRKTAFNHPKTRCKKAKIGEGTMDFNGRKAKRVLGIGFWMSILVLVSACRSKSRVIDTKFAQEMSVDSLKTSLLLANMSHLKSENVRIIAVKWSAPDSTGHQYKVEELELVKIAADSCVFAASLESSLQSHNETSVVRVSTSVEKVQQGANKWHLRVFCLLSAIILLTILFAWIRKKAFWGL